LYLPRSTWNAISRTPFQGTAGSFAAQKPKKNKEKMQKTESRLSF
jgi:hypothetical protein